MEKTVKKILVSGVKPTGRPHLGNYFGAMKQFVKLQDEYDSRIFIADLHALTTVQNAAELRQNILDVALDYLAIGLDPKKVTLFKQSDVPEVAELAWIFNCITTMPFLERAHAYKDAVAKGREVNVGTFDYPLLMAADILIQDADVVPVGADQKQHVEYARDTAEKFNRIFGGPMIRETRSIRGLPDEYGYSKLAGQDQIFKLPEPLILENVKVVPGTDGQKMSKSHNNTIPLFASDTEIEKLAMGIVTDSSAGVPKNVYEIHKLFRSEGELAKLYKEHEGKYKVLKEALIADIKAFIRPLLEKRKAIADDTNTVLKVLKDGGNRAKEKASAKMELLREEIGVKLY